MGHLSASDLFCDEMWSKNSPDFFVCCFFFYLKQAVFTFKFGKQCRLRSDAAEWGIWSLFANSLVIFLHEYLT